MTARPKPPAGLSEASAALWPSLVADLRAVTGAAGVDLLLLEDVLRAMDRLQAVRAVLDREGMTTTGSKGQTRPHPLLATEAALRRDVANGLERLHLAPSKGREACFTVAGGGRLRKRYG